ncbi:MAG TPA: Hsp70 family protein [Patescibacteria group bacterium]|nr:Hsp70 family protein [Patescibacteria group bacterium]
MARAIGIDLGTTNSVVASVTRGRPHVIPSGTGDVDWTSSLVARENGSFVVGREVEAIVQTRASRAVHSVKRLIGRRFADDEVQRMIGDGRFHFPVIEHPGHAGEIGIQLDDLVMTPAEVSAQVLRTLRSDAAAHLGEAVGHAVITVPAYFRDPSIFATREAGRIAGLRVQHVMPEPTAAALAYALGEDAAGTSIRHVLVYDFGGGTFDVSILLAAPNSPLQVLTVAGNNFLGGDDIDVEIARRWDRLLRADLGVSILDDIGISDRGMLPLEAVKWTLRLAARETKERLAGSAPTRSVSKPGLILRDDGTAISPTWTLSRDELADIARPYIDRTFEVVQRALSAAHLGAADITDVVVVGGSTKLAGVLDQLRLMFHGAEIRNSINPMLVVGIGAAQQTRTALPWTCAECGRTNEAVAERCLGCGAESDHPGHDCVSCGAIFAPMDATCPNPACATLLVRPEAPVEVLSHAYKVRLVGGEWETLVERGTPIQTSRREAAAPSRWVELRASRTGQRIELPIGQDHDYPGRPPQVEMHFDVINPPVDIIAGDRVALRLSLDGDRISSIEAEIGGRLYATRRVDFADGDVVDASGSGRDEAAASTGKAWWYRFLAAPSVMLPERPANPGAVAFIDSLRDASDELRSIADQLEEAEEAGDAERADALIAQADEHINENLPIVPSLAMATFLTGATDDLDARRDLQAAVEDVLQALGTGDAADLRLAFASLRSVMDGVNLPDRSTPGGVDANLLARFGRR